MATQTEPMSDWLYQRWRRMTPFWRGFFDMFGFKHVREFDEEMAVAHERDMRAVREWMRAGVKRVKHVTMHADSEGTEMRLTFKGDASMTTIARTCARVYNHPSPPMSFGWDLSEAECSELYEVMRVLAEETLIDEVSDE